MRAIHGSRWRWLVLARGLIVLGAATGCAGGSEPDPTPQPSCASQALTHLAPGEVLTVAASVDGACVRLASDANLGSEYLVLAYSANLDQQPAGARGDFVLSAGADAGALRVGAAPAAAPVPMTLHDRLRQQEAAAARVASARIMARVSAPPVTLNDSKVFQVCADLSCTAKVPVTATARYVGSPGVVFLDDSVPAGGYTQLELDSLGTLFDQWIYPVDTTAFGRESDVDGNGQVLILLTDQVNHLSTGCASSSQLVVGYFSGLDLLDQAGSNRAEVFFGMVPDPASATCVVDHATARRLVPPVMIHEFQHMLSYRRHVLLAGGLPEATWLNEGLSQFAEELGGRRLPAALCVGQNCLNQFGRNNIVNAYDFLSRPEAHFLVEPGSSSGTLPERGANWLFVRWLAEQAAGDSAYGTSITRALLGADAGGGRALRGAANVVDVAERSFAPGTSAAALLSEWHSANYVESRTDLTPPARLSYRSWNLVGAFNQVVFGPYPLRPDSVAGRFSWSGELLGGSGRVVRLTRTAGAAPLAVTLTGSPVALVAPYLSIRRLK